MTSIEWCDETWNPVRGCSRVSPGCDHCYAIGQAHRFSGAGQPYEGLTVLRPKTAKRPGVDWTGTARLHPEMLSQPLRWRKPRRVFVNSMSDLFHSSLSNEDIAAVFGVMAACPQHTFQCLTKRPKRMAEWFEWVRTPALDRIECCANDALEQAGCAPLNWDSVGEQWPLPNVWLGVSVEDQQRADERIPLLLECPATLRFISAEPLLGPLSIDGELHPTTSIHVSVDIEGAIKNRAWRHGGFTDGQGRELSPTEVESHFRKLRQQGHKLLGSAGCDNFDPQKGCGGHRQAGLDWVIVGGESGTGARSLDVRWVRSIVKQCRGADVPCFVKQLGAHVVDQNDAGFDGDPDDAWSHHVTVEDLGERRQGALVRVRLNHRKGADPNEWPEDLRVREFPEVSRG